MTTEHCLFYRIKYFLLVTRINEMYSPLRIDNCNDTINNHSKFDFNSIAGPGSRILRHQLLRIIMYEWDNSIRQQEKCFANDNLSVGELACGLARNSSQTMLGKARKRIAVDAKFMYGASTHDTREIYYYAALYIVLYYKICFLSLWLIEGDEQSKQQGQIRVTDIHFFWSATTLTNGTSISHTCAEMITYMWYVPNSLDFNTCVWHIRKACSQWSWLTWLVVWTKWNVYEYERVKTSLIHFSMRKNNR